MPASRSAPHVWLTARDRQMLSYTAEHRLVLERQLASLVGSSVGALQERMRSLASAGYLTRVRVFDEFCCLIRRPGLTAVGSELPRPQFKLSTYKHDVGVAWLWLAAGRGVFGPVAEVLAERRVRSHDEAVLAPEDRYAVRVGGYREDGAECRHYPDLVLVDPRGRRLALELELSPKKIARRETILSGYGADRRLDGVVYLVENHSAGRSIGRAIETSAAKLNLLDRVHVRLLKPIRFGPCDASRARGHRRASHVARVGSAVAEAAR